jgi:hypothetical protein
MRTDLRDNMFNKTSFLGSFSSTTGNAKPGNRLTYSQQRDPSYDSFSKYRSEMNNEVDYNSSPNIGGLITQSNGSRPLTSSLNQTDGFNRISFR